MKSFRLLILALYVLASFQSLVGHDHGLDSADEKLVHEASCYDDCPHFAGHSAPAQHTPEHCPACQFQNVHYAPDSAPTFGVDPSVAFDDLPPGVAASPKIVFPYSGRAPPQV